MPTTTGRYSWGWRVTTSNQALPFDRGGNKDGTLRLGDYGAGLFATEVARAMNAADTGQAYTCAYNFSTRKFTVDNGATAFALEFTRNASTNCAGLLGFDDLDRASTADGHTSTDTVGVTNSFFNTAGVKSWAPVDPAVTNTPVTAAADGTTAALLQRKPRVIQHETDGGLRETIFFSTDKLFRIEYRMLSAAEQVLFDSLMDWLETGAPVDFRPDDTAASTINMRLVLANPGETRNTFSWTTRTEADVGTLEFIQQLARV